ncbi:RDD family protein [Nocardia sp. NPDC087230]|uniref:RDD family protein n=1 Tax=Nocardia sp. NPDC087230 TaxID=3364331 RepID=UPI003813EFEF
MNGTDVRTARAWSTPRTLWTLLWTTVRALVVLGLGVACAVAFVHFVEVSQTETGRTAQDADRMALLCFFAVLPLTVTGIVMTRTAFRRWLSARHRWQVWRIETLRTGIQEWVHLIDDRGTIAGTVVLRKWTSRTFSGDDELVWFAGVPNKAGLIAKPGGTRTQLAYRSLFYTPPRFGTSLFVKSEPSAPIPQPRSASPATTSEPPGKHGGWDDPAFPSPRKLRRTLAYPLDVALHLAIGVGVVFFTDEATRHAVTHQEWNSPQIKWWTMIGCFLLASFVDRVVFQAVTRTTLGKAVFGLVIIDRDTGRAPRARRLLAAWLIGVIMPLLVLGDSSVPERPERYLLPAVRRTDARRVIRQAA